MVATIAGTLLFYVLLQASIALHEAGHLAFAKLFGVRVQQFMVGLGPTMKSWRRGETEYGFKWIPFGGYNRMIGMLGPRKGPPKQGRIARFVDNARAGSLYEVEPGEEHRAFYARPWWQKALICVSGSVVNLVLAFVFIAIWLMGIGYQESDLTVAAVEAGSPAAVAGLKPGDTVTSVDGQPVDDYRRLNDLVAAGTGRTVPVTVSRDGASATAQVALNGDLGVTMNTTWARQGLGGVFDKFGQMTAATVAGFAHVGATVKDLWTAATGGQRDPQGAIGIVGAARVGGQALADSGSFKERAAWFLMLLGTVNFGWAALNLIPLPPFDGGQVVGALWEGLRKGLARLLRRPDPGYVDVAKILPLTYVVSAALMLLLALTFYVDIVNPVQVDG